MTKDDRLYAKFTLDFPDSPKILPLPVEAKWAYVEMVIYSRRLLTDGYISKPLALAKWGLDVCLALLTNDPVKPSLIEVENGYQIHDFAEIQSTRAEIEALTEKRKAAGSKGGTASAEAKRKQVLKQNASKINPETEIETEKRTTTKSMSDPAGSDEPTTLKSVYPKAFETWWEHYPRKDSKRTALAAWKRAKKRATDEQLTEGAKRYAADPNRKPGYTKLPATWLNGDCWLSDAIPGDTLTGIDWDSA